MQRSVALFVCTLLCFLVPTVDAQPRTREVPAPPDLAQWRDWILYAHPDANCPTADGQNKTVCAWPSRLKLDITADGGRFEQTWTLYRDMAVPLPGNNISWPLNVRASAKQVPVTAGPGSNDQNTVPHVFLRAGTTTIRGEFQWRNAPAQLPIPSATGLLALTLDGKAVVNPRREKGRLILSARRARSNQIDSLDLHVSRILTEAVPFSIQTEIKLEVAGRSREITLNNPELPDTRLFSVSSPLPIKRNDQGDLVVQVRSGQWHLRFRSIHTAVPTELTVPEPKALWADHELWVYMANERLRTVTPRQMIAVDPTQTHLDSNYHRFPCFFGERGQTLKLEERQRGLGIVKPNEMSLNRTIWLDQSGDGATFRDVIQVTPHRDWRLEMNQPFQPGNAQVYRVSQLLTSHPETGRPGLSLRSPTNNLKVEGRLEQSVSRLPASGWNTDLDRLNITVNLPPGWQAFTALGPESVDGDWLRSWRLWHVFWVLIIAGAVTKLWHWRLGVLALSCLVLIYHQLHAPRAVWLFLLVWIALARYVTMDRLKPLIKLGKAATWFLTVLWVTVFVGQQLLAFFYPQLERVRLPDLLEGRASRQVGFPAAPGFQTAVDQGEMDMVMEEPMAQSKSMTNYISKKPQKTFRFKKKDQPPGDIQTGPGVPEWRHNRLQLSWANPVAQDEQVRLILLSPWQNKLLILIRIGLTLAFLALLLRLDGLLPGKAGAKKGLAAALLLVAAPLFGQNQVPQQNNLEINAEFSPPAEDLLETYEARLLQKPPCGDHCVSIDSARLRINGGMVETTLTLHVQATAALPLPGRPTQVRDGVGKTPPLWMAPNGVVWATSTAGIHQLTLRQPLPQEGTLIMAWPKPPRRLETQTGDWQVIGVGENGRVTNQIELRPKTPVNNEEAGKNQERIQAEPYLRVTREIEMAKDWTVVTRVTTTNKRSVLINIPLLPGERLLSSDFKANENGVAVALSAARSSVQWESRLEKTDSLTLQAPADQPWSEHWRLTASPLWLVTWQGTPLIDYRASSEPGAAWAPAWRPRPGESLTLKAQRPDRVGGQTLTIDAVSLDIEAGNRLQTTRFSFNLRTSTGGEYQLPLPPDVELQELKVNGKETTMIVEDRILKISYSPGEVTIAGSWRQSKPSSLVIQSPELNLGHPSVNIRHDLEIGRNRWILGTFGPQMGPSVLFWPLFVLLILIAVPLGRLKLMPLGTASWFLLGLGILQLGIGAMAAAVAWFFVVGFYAHFAPHPKSFWTYLKRLMLIGFTMIFLGILAAALSQGLLGQPNMYIYGPNRPVTDLAWYSPRGTGIIPSVGVITVSIWVYRFLMLLWALWLANGLLGWLKWAWSIVFAPMTEPPPPAAPTPHDTFTDPAPPVKEPPAERRAEEP